MNIKHNHSDEINISDWKNIIPDYKSNIIIIDSDFVNKDILINPDIKLVILDTTKISTTSKSYWEKECSSLNKPILALITKEMGSKVHLEKDYTDFIISPINNAELTARIRKILHQHNISFKDSTIQIGDISINLESYDVFVKQNRITLRFKEFQLLQLLISHPEKVYSRETLLNQIWGYNYFGGTRTVDVHIRRLRSKISGSKTSFIETIWNVGYRFRKK